MSDTTGGNTGVPGRRQPTLEHLDALVGEWASEATHRLLPNTTIHGRATFEWLEGGFFLIWRAHYDHPDIPDSIAILGCDDSGDGCSIRYFDSRGVSRVYQLGADAGVWRYWRDWPGFSQRFTGTFSDDGDTITGIVELSEDDSTWVPDLPITYKRIR